VQSLTSKVTTLSLKSRQTLNKLTQDCAKYTLKHLKLDKALKAAELSVLITDNKTIQKINKETRGKNYATNVLSFPFLDFKEGLFKVDNDLDSLFQGNDTAYDASAVSSSRKLGSKTNINLSLKRKSQTPIILGDIICSYEKLQEEANAQSKPINNHFTHLMVHSILHLLGFDHEKAKDAKKMEALEIEILAKYFKIKNPYIS